MLAQAGYYKYQNLGEALLYGADAEVKWDIDRNWFVSLNGTWQKSLDYSKYLFVQIHQAKPIKCSCHIFLFYILIGW